MSTGRWPAWGWGCCAQGGRDQSAVVQRHLDDNQLKAWAGYVPGDRARHHSRAEATAGLLGVLDDALAPDPALYGWQRDLRNNQVLAHAQDRRGAQDSPGARWTQPCASPGHGFCPLCAGFIGRFPGRRVWRSTAVAVANGMPEQQRQAGSWAASHVPAWPLLRRCVFCPCARCEAPAHLKQEACRPGAGTGGEGMLVERALLAPVIREALVQLLCIRSVMPSCPCWLPWDGAINQYRRQSVLDTAGYQLGDFNEQ